MSAYVLDTSVAVAWYLQEEFSHAARAYRERLAAGSIRCVVPSLHFWEFGNVLRTYVLRGELAGDLAREVFEVHLEAGLEIAEPDRGHVLAIAFEYGATVYDAVYIALALEHELPLLTAEKTTTPWVSRLADRILPVRRRVI